jgi:anti-sigma factor RsiW
MTCDELLAMLNEYVDGPVDPGVCQEFERHLAGCNPCQVVVDNIRKTITLYKEGQPYELPEPFRDRLRTTLRAKWKERARSSTPTSEAPSQS